VRGVAHGVVPSAGLRFICYCDDCQTFARFLGRADILDPAGGTDILHMPPAHVTLATGAEALRALRLSEKGVIRWYSACCRTPIANTADSARFPVIGLIHCFMDHEADGRSRDAALGPPFCRIFERSAVAPLRPMAVPSPLEVFVRRGAKVLSWWLRGLARPSPFFTAGAGAPRADPRVLTKDERSAL